jgi:hypothetical protein
MCCGITKIFEKAFGFLGSPSKAFDKEKKADLGESFKYLLVLLLIPSILGGLVAAVIFGVLGTMMGPFLPGMMPYAGASVLFIFLTTAIFGYIIGIIGSVIWSLWLHLWAYIFSAKQGLEQTMKSVFYGGTPLYLFGWIPLASIIFAIWSLVLHGIGLTRLQKLEGGQAAAAIIIAIVIPIAIIIIIVATLIAMFLPYMSMMGTGPTGFD